MAAAGAKWGAVVLATISALALHAPMAAAFEPTDVLTPESRTPEWTNLLNDLFGHVQECNFAARTWFRMVFHDCGTFNRFQNDGGCDGSLALDEELNRPENRFARSTIDIYLRALEDHGEGQISMADTIIAGGLLSLVACHGPTIPFTPGRNDVFDANPAGRLPDRNEDVDTILFKMREASFFPRESVVIIGAGHTISQGGLVPNGLDDTPNIYDNKFFVELHRRERAGDKLKSDQVMLKNNMMGAWIRFFAENEAEFFRQSVKVITKMINLVPRNTNALAASMELDKDKASAA